MTWSRLALALVAVLAGCGSSSHPAGAKQTALDFYSAVASRHGAKACSLLTPGAVRLATAGKGSCSTQLIDEIEFNHGTKLPKQAKLVSFKQSGDNAGATFLGKPRGPFQVLLARVGGSWKVRLFL
jgi:hypothetical protein